MDTKSDEQFLTIKSTIESNKQEADRNQVKTDAKLTKITEDLQKLTTLMIDQANISKSFPSQKDTSTPPYPTTTVHTNRRAPPLEGGISENIGGVWTLKHEISSPRFYELLIKTDLKGDTAMDLKNFFNHVMMSLNAVTRLREDLLPDYHFIKRNSHI